MEAFGWTWEYIDEEMTLQRMASISKRWQEVPPLAVSVAGIYYALVGGKKETAAKKQDPMELFEALGAAGFKQGTPEWLRQATP